jgi:RNA polymerase sigma-70 factor, ECF subfamily
LQGDATVLPNSPPSVRVDADMVSGIVAGDPESLNQLFGRYAAGIFSLACRISRNRALAEEATQDVFVQVWRDASSYDPARGSVRAWLLTIARGRTLDRLRAQQVRNGRACRVEDADESGALRDRGSSPESSAAESEHNAVMDTVLAVLPPDDRRLVELAYFRGLTQTQIAATLQLPLGTVKSQMRRVLKLLRSALSAQVRAPFAWNARPAGLPAPVIDVRSCLRDLRVLVVDDDVDTLRLLTLVLERAGATVTPASSAAQALSRLDAGWPDAVMTDLEMPEKDGYALLEEVKRRAVGRGAHLPAVAFTAHGAAPERTRVRRAGFDLHVVKPVRPSVLVIELAQLIRGFDSAVPDVS